MKGLRRLKQTGKKLTKIKRKDRLCTLKRRAVISTLLAILLTSFLFVVYSFTAHAADDPATGDRTERTNINEAGTAGDADSLSELNIANAVSLSFGEGNGSINGALQVLIVLTLITLAPTLLVMLTSFTRIIVVLHFTRAALNTQTSPPNIVLIGLALFLTFFIMKPTINTVWNDAVVPFDEGKITQEEMFEKASGPIRTFMSAQTQEADVLMFMEIGGYTWDHEIASIPMEVLIPSFIISELRTAFIIGFIIYIPFIVIDMVVSSVLMSMGMMMLPPTTISMPFKILLFILADGWNLVIGNLVKTFY